MSHRVIHIQAHQRSGTTKPLIGEEPLSIRIQGRPYSVIMRTPGDERAHVAGFCLGEGIVDAPEELSQIAFCDGADTNVVTVTLTSARRRAMASLLDRRGFISQTSCGLCGKEIVRDLSVALKPFNDALQLAPGRLLDLLERLGEHQPLRRRTRAAHAAAVCDDRYRLISLAEDVGRHNALDKAVGRLFLERRLPSAAFVLLSSRISYELVQKAARARIPVVAAISRPTSLAVDLAASLKMTLACLAGKSGGLYVFCGAQRLTP